MPYDVVLVSDMTSRIWYMRPLGAYRLASELRNHGYRVLVIDFFSKWLRDMQSFKLLLAKVITDDTLVFGYSSSFFSNDNAYKETPEDWYDYSGSFLTQWPASDKIIQELNEFVRTCSHDIKILYGGSGAGRMNEGRLADSGVDYVVQGLADSVIIDLLQAIKNKQFIKYNYKNGCKVIDYDTTAKNFDFPNSVTRYEASDCLDRDEVVPLETSRGCIFKCSFCSFPLLGRKKSDPAYHKHVSVLANEFKENYERYGITRYMFVDDTFNESVNKLNEVYQSIQHSGVDVKFSCYLRLDLLERFPEQIPLLRNMGLQTCFLGIETLNSQAMKSIGKHIDKDRVMRTLELCREHWHGEVTVFGSFIAGLPHETVATVDEWMAWVYDRHDLIQGFVVAPLYITYDRFPQSILGANPEQYGYTIRNHQDWTNNLGMTQLDAMQLQHRWMNKAWKSGRLLPSGHDMIGLQNLGLDFDQLKNRPLNKLPFDLLRDSYMQKVSGYQSRLKAYIDTQSSNLTTGQA